MGATQDGRVVVQRADRMWSTREENGKPLQYSCLENPMNRMKKENESTVSIRFSFHTVHEVLKARILKWFAILFSNGPHFVRTLQHDPSVLGGPIQHGS